VENFPHGPAFGGTYLAVGPPHTAPNGQKGFCAGVPIGPHPLTMASRGFPPTHTYLGEWAVFSPLQKHPYQGVPGKYPLDRQRVGALPPTPPTLKRPIQGVPEK
jgi:hypothetical protein